MVMNQGFPLPATAAAQLLKVGEDASNDGFRTLCCASLAVNHSSVWTFGQMRPVIFVLQRIIKSSLARMTSEDQGGQDSAPSTVWAHL